METSHGSECLLSHCHRCPEKQTLGKRGTRTQIKHGPCDQAASLWAGDSLEEEDQRGFV